MTSTLTPETRDKRQDDRLLRAYAETRDPALREQLVTRYLPLARHVAQRYARGSELYDDLVQVASLGLLKAIDRFDPGRGAFSSYAVPTMAGEIRRYFRDRTWTVRPPRDLQDRCLLVERVQERLTASGRRPTAQDLATATGLEVEEVLEALMASPARDGVSFAATGPTADGDGATLEDRLGYDDAGLGHAEARVDLHRLGSVLTPREREVVRLRFEHDLRQEEIGRIVGVSQMQISRILRAALDKLRIAAEARA